MDNCQQYDSIRRYHQHLSRLGRNIDLETAAREWIHRFASRWREHRDRQRSIILRRPAVVGPNSFTHKLQTDR